MKLRNKQTGETITLKNDRELALLKFVESSLPNGLRLWEEVKEPLIKDEKVRKAIRAWAEACFIETVEYDEYWVSFRRDDKTISFKDEDRCLGFYELENSRDYTIDELCGEEEE